MACDAITFLGNRASFLRGRSEAGRFERYDLPDPTSTPLCPSLVQLFTPRPSTAQSPRGEDKNTVAKLPNSGEYARALEMEYKGEKWGRDVDKPDLIGRNRAALTVSLRKLTVFPSKCAAWRETCASNRDMVEALPEAELRHVFESARRYVQA